MWAELFHVMMISGKNEVLNKLVHPKISKFAARRNYFFLFYPRTLLTCSKCNAQLEWWCLEFGMGLEPFRILVHENIQVANINCFVFFSSMTRLPANQ